ncbi:cilia- and flagella-associated protein 77 [Rhineura floridana]|uniref:cilia- and flagella-associated protein 77 n=1 Tax=Rhineura floridana TaxID=261503 RepID=UPI002AC7FF56|nr:cilia- and flagella-associated protein 77 [Rhineura floridana]
MAAEATTANTPVKKAAVMVRLPRRRSVGQICPPPRRPMTLSELYPGCENERLGVTRDSMLQNHLIAKPEVGKPRRSCYTLPGYTFNYGLYLHGLDGGVPEAIGHWNSIKPRVLLAKERPRDYKTSNNKAIKDGFVTAHENYLYCKMKDIRLNEDDERRFKKTPPKVPVDMTYGRPARPSTPFFQLLQHKYKEIWMDQQRAVIKAEKAEKKQKKRRGKTYDTRTTLLRKFQPPMQAEPLWQMRHFQKLPLPMPHPVLPAAFAHALRPSELHSSSLPASSDGYFAIKARGCTAVAKANGTAQQKGWRCQG